MDLAFRFTHTTYSPILLAAGAVIISLFVFLLSNRRLMWPAGILASAATAGLVVVAGEHIPIVSALAPRTFCFGNIGVTHIVAFSLPAIAFGAGRRSPSKRIAG